jgi:molybdopterin-guanine dinucleotide biosynthesis protein A
VAHRPLTGVLLVGGASERFGSPKALALAGAETLAERGWRTLGEACDERLAVGKRGELELPFDVIDDVIDVRAPIAGVIAGLRAATNDVCVFLPVDCPDVTAEVIRAFGDACRDTAVTRDGPLPGAWAKAALPVLERRLRDGRFTLAHAYDELDVATVEVDPALTVDADTPEELAHLLAR